jgi:hypothetical protein
MKKNKIQSNFNSGGLLDLPNVILNYISLFLDDLEKRYYWHNPYHTEYGVDNILKAVCTHLSGKEDRYATRWAAKAYNKSSLLPLKSTNEPGCLFLYKVDSEHLADTYSQNCFKSLFYSLIPVSAMVGVP